MFPMGRLEHPSVVGIDIGGTFTDFYFVSAEGLKVRKVLSSAQAPSDVIKMGVRGLPMSSWDVVHGSTIATNALIESQGCRTALVATDGFQDLIEIGRQDRPDIYNPMPRRPDVLVPQDLRIGVSERISADGGVLLSLTDAEIERVVARVGATNAEAVAVCFLFSFIYPEHEKLITDALRGEGYFVTASHEILPEYREHERMTTTVLNSYLSQLVGESVDEVDKASRGRSFLVMQSHGGVTSSADVMQNPLSMVMSGPAAGVLAAQRISGEAGYKMMISFDMGGTSTDVALATTEYPRSSEGSIAGRSYRLRSCDVETVGAGGGSIAWIDPAGSLKVGPESAGASPGPASYGTGILPTVCDANLVLGRLHAEAALGNGMKMDRARAIAAIEPLATEIGTSVEDAALAIADIVDSNMARAIRRVSLEKGHDPAQAVLVAYGGAGPQHACDVARAMDINAVLIPPSPGALSAQGLVMADKTKEKAIGCLGVLTERASETIGQILDGLSVENLSDLHRLSVRTEHAEHKYWLDLRYLGQSYEISVPVRLLDGRSELDWERAVADFHSLHRIQYGFSHQNKDIEHVAVRALASIPSGVILGDRSATERDSSHTLLEGSEHQMWFHADGTSDTAPKQYSTQVFLRDELSSNRIDGPALVLQHDSTVVIPPDFFGAADALGNLVLQSVNS